MKNIQTFERFINESYSINEAASVPSNVMEFAKRKGSYATALVKKVATWAEKAGKRINGGTAIGKNYSTLVLDMKHQGSEIYINLDNETVELFGELVKDAKSFKKVLDDNAQNESIKESKDEFVPATLIEDFEDLRKGDSVKINALDYTTGGDKEAVESIRPDGKKMEIKKAILTVKI